MDETQAPRILDIADRFGGSDACIHLTTNRQVTHRHRISNDMSAYQKQKHLMEWSFPTQSTPTPPTPNALRSPLSAS